jgi:hypothetical protein
MKKLFISIITTIIFGTNIYANIHAFLLDDFKMLEFYGYDRYSKIINEDLFRENDLEKKYEIIKKIRIKYAEDLKKQFEEFNNKLQSLSPREEDWIKSELDKIKSIKSYNERSNREYNLKKTDEYIKYFLKKEIDKKIYILNGIIHSENDFKEMYGWTQLGNTYYDLHKNNESKIICYAKKKGIGFIIENDLKCNDPIFVHERITTPYLFKTRSIYKDLLQTFLMYHWQSKYDER